MSIIGPRPLLVSYLPWYTEEEKQRHDVRPGLSGLAGEASLEHFEEILDLLLQKQSESDLVVGSVTCYEGTLEDRANRIEQRRQKYSEYEQKCLEEIEQLTKQRDEALEKQEVKK